MVSTSDDAPTSAAVYRGLHNKPSPDTISVLTDDALTDRYDNGFSEPNLFGREHDATRIRTAWKRVKEGKRSEVVVVSGRSGTGKSALIETLRSEVTRGGARFVYGKYDQLPTAKEPFSALAAAMSDLCDLVLQSNESEEICALVASAVGSNVWALAKLVSNVTEMVRIDEANDHDIPTTTTTENEPFETFHPNDFQCFKSAFLNFIRAVATESYPLLMFVDDIQWADERSTRLIEAMVNDEDSAHVLYCFTHRDDEGARIPDSLKGERDNQSCCMVTTKIHLHDLTAEHVTNLLCPLLGREATAVQPLCDFVMNKTRGNPRAVVEILDLLKTKGLVVYSKEAISWEWNMAEVESEFIDFSDAIVTAKVEKHDEQVQDILKFAAFIGHNFSLAELCAIVQQKEDTIIIDCAENLTSSIESEILHQLQGPIEDRLIVELKPGFFKFSHDSVQEAFFKAVDQTQRDLIHHRVGKGLMSLLRRQSTCLNEASVKFLASQSLVKGKRPILSESDRLETIRLLLDVGCRAASQTAYNDSLSFLEYAETLLQKERDFQENPELCCSVLNRIANVQICIGNFKECAEAMDEVLSHVTSQTERTKAILTKLWSLVYQWKPIELRRLASKILYTEGDERIPFNPSLMQVLLEMTKTKMALRGMRPRAFLDRPLGIASEKKMIVMEVVSTINPYIGMTHKGLLFQALLVFRVARYSANYGASCYTADSLAQCAILQVSFGRYAEAFEFAQVAVELSKRYEVPGQTARCESILNVLVAPHVQPIPDLLEGMWEGYLYSKRGTRSSGSATEDFMGLMAYLESNFCLDMKLSRLEKLIKKHYPEIEHSCTLQPILSTTWQATLNYLGRSDDPTVLSGEIIEESKLLSAIRTSGHIIAELHFHAKKLGLQLSFEDFDSIESTMMAVVKDQYLLLVPFTKLFVATDVALAAMGLYQRRKKRKFRRIGRSQLKMIQKWNSLGVPSAQPMLSLLEAEWLFVNDKSARCAYVDAVEKLKENRFTHLTSFACQRAMHCWSTQHKKKSQDFLLTNIDLCQGWGNKAKEEWLRRTYSHVLVKVRPTISVSISKKVTTGFHDRSLNEFLGEVS